MVVAAAAAAVVANPVAVVPVGSSAYRKKAGTAAGALETSFSQSPSLSLLVRISTSKAFASISIPTAPLFPCSQGTVSLRVDRARQRSSRSSISASANQVQFGNQDSESTLLNASVQPSLLDTSAKFRTSAEGVTKNAAAQEFEQLLMRKAQELKEEIEGTCIFLIGMMGSGKSTVGRLLAEALEYQFLDSDTVIESYAGGLSVAEIFKKWKEERFRELEVRI
jgi:ABC-type dipeptide/oligopeptide/nickel transport system ATPase subunit